jgi:hypothetical protein
MSGHIKGEYCNAKSLLLDGHNTRITGWHKCVRKAGHYGPHLCMCGAEFTMVRT